MNKDQILQTYADCILNTYTRTPLIFVKGKGMVLTDIHDKKYLDFFPGWGVANVGHCHPKVMAGIRDQVGKLIHIPNNFYHPHQAKLAQEIIRHSFDGKVFFCNSGAEAVEGCVKFARAFGNSEKFEVISTLKSFHGRTLAALSATGQPHHHVAFQPLPTGFTYVPFNDFAALRNAVTPKTAAILLELVQGEGGVNVATQAYVKSIRQLCDQNNILLIIDEVQTGMGRTGTMFAFQQYDILPDLIAMAKALGGGVPIGTFVVKKAIAETFKPGMHGSTFGGSPLMCKAALGVFAALKSDKMLDNVKTMGPYFMSRLTGLQKKYSVIKDVRGLGLMIGVDLSIDGKNIVDECLNHGLIINCTQGHVLRMSPALNVTAKQIDKAVHILDIAFQKAGNP